MPAENRTGIENEYPERSITIATASQYTGFSSDYIIRQVIEKHKIISPEKTGSYRGKKTYLLTREEFNRIWIVARLKKQGYSIAEIKLRLKNYDSNRDAISLLAETIKKTGWENLSCEELHLLLVSFIDLPGLSEIEKFVMYMTWIHYSSEEIATELNISLEEVKILKKETPGKWALAFLNAWEDYFDPRTDYSAFLK